MLNLCGIVGVELPAIKKGMGETLPTILVAGATKRHWIGDHEDLGCQVSGSGRAEQLAKTRTDSEAKTRKSWLQVQVYYLESLQSKLRI